MADVKSRRWIWIVGGAVFGATLAPMAMWLLALSDDAAIHMPGPIKAASAIFWLVTAFPGVILANKGLLTWAFVCCFWGVVGGVLGGQLEGRHAAKRRIPSSKSDASGAD